jgi:hypothetical protein
VSRNGFTHIHHAHPKKVKKKKKPQGYDRIEPHADSVDLALRAEVQAADGKPQHVLTTMTFTSSISLPPL